MNAITVVTDVDAAPPLLGVALADVIQVREGIAFTRIAAGMQSGRSAVGITAPVGNDKHVYLELSMANFLNAAEIFRAKEEQTHN